MPLLDKTESINQKMCWILDGSIKSELVELGMKWPAPKYIRRHMRPKCQCRWRVIRVPVICAPESFMLLFEKNYTYEKYDA